MQGQSCAHVVELSAAAQRVSMWLLVREEGLRGAGEGKTDGPFRLKQALSTWSTCLPDARDRQRASMADLEGCVYSGKCVGQVSSLKAGF